MKRRYVVTLSRISLDDVELVVLGPFQSLKAAERRAGVVRRVANTYDDVSAVLDVVVEPLEPGSVSAQRALDLLYGAVE